MRSKRCSARWIAASSIGLFLVLFGGQAQAQRISTPTGAGDQTLNPTLKVLGPPSGASSGIRVSTPNGIVQEAKHAKTAGHAETAGHAGTAGHAETASSATTAGSSDFALEAGSAEQADVATTLSPDSCVEGEILRKGASEWECVPMPVGGGSVLTALPDEKEWHRTAYAFGGRTSQDLDEAEMVLPRDGWLRNLVVRVPYCAGGRAEVTVLVNGFETDLQTKFDSDLDGCSALLANLDVQIPVYLGDTITFRFEQPGNLSRSERSGFSASVVFD